MTIEQDRYRGALLGLACGDAIGQGAEHTATALRLAHSLLERGGFDVDDALAARDLGLVRLAPVSMYYALAPETAIRHAAAGTSQSAQEAVDRSRLFALQLCSALAGKPKDSILSPHFPGPLSPTVEALAQGEYRNKTVEQISAFEPLEAALWCFWHTTSFKQAVLAAANLGDGADTATTVCGQLAGAYYGVQDIPGEWLDKLAMSEELLNVADSLLTKRAPSKQ